MTTADGLFTARYRLIGLGVIVTVSLAALAIGPPLRSVPAQDDEFVGPFRGWTNVKLAYGARGDGVADDTPAIQRALDDVGRADGWSVLYVPAGRYRLTTTLVLTSRIHITLVGEDPATTTLVWDGPNGGTMLWINGLAYSRV